MQKASISCDWLRYALVMLLSCTSTLAQNLITKQITVQPIQVRSTDGVTAVANPNLILYEAESDKIWAQAGIDIKFLAPMTYDNSTFLNIASSTGQVPNELVLLRQTAGQPWSLNGALPNTVIRLFFAQLIDGFTSNLGFTLQSSVTSSLQGTPIITSQVFVAIADNAFAINRLDVIAHELGHSLSLNHMTLGAGGTLNLMSSPRTSPSTITDMYPTGALADQLTGAITAGNPDWTTEQIDRARIMPQALDLPVEQQYIYKSSQTITFAALGDRVFSATPFTLSATSSSGLTVSFSVESGPATITGNELTMTGSGIVTVRAAQAGNANYNAAPVVDRSFTITGGGPDFTTWQQANFTAGELADINVSGPNAVFGLDGYPNLVKYALGLDPKIDATSGLPVVSVPGTDWVYTYTRPDNVSDVTYTVEISTDLINWTTAGVIHEFVSTAGGIDTWRGRYPLASAVNVYFRLKVVR